MNISERVPHPEIDAFPPVYHTVQLRWPMALPIGCRVLPRSLVRPSTPSNMAFQERRHDKGIVGGHRVRSSVGRTGRPEATDESVTDGGIV